MVHFDLDLRKAWTFNPVADLDFEPIVLEEDESTILTLDGNGAKLRRKKHQSTTPEHVGFTVQDRLTYEKNIQPHITKLDSRRLEREDYALQRRLANEEDRLFIERGKEIGWKTD